VAEGMQQVPPSRSAEPEEWVEVMTAEIDRRFGGYEGDRLYHFGISVDGYSLAPPGIPVVLSTRSVLVLSVNVWDDALGQKLHEEPEQIVVFEGTSPETILGSGYARTREEQMQLLARNAARRIQLWMLQNPEWFNIDPDAAEVAAAEIAEIAEASETPLDAAGAVAAEAGEAEGQPPFARIAEAAEASGIEARCLPVTPGRITDADVTAFARVLSDLPGPAHAYCRTGTRSAMLWAMTMAGTEPLEDIVASTGAAGYDLGPLMPRLSARDATPG